MQRSGVTSESSDDEEDRFDDKEDRFDDSLNAKREFHIYCQSI
jgi:hypothetical protein